MLSRSGDRELRHKYWIRANEGWCLKKMQGECDKLGQDPKEYPSAMKAIAAYEFLYPFLIVMLWTFYTAQFAFSTIVIVFSGVFLPILPLIVGANIIAVVVLLSIGVIIEIAFLYHLYKQIGVYAAIPAIAFVVQVLLSLVPIIGAAVAAIVGFLPWGIIALGVHYIHYQVGIGVVFNADKSCYLQGKKSGKRFDLDW